jgi:hypothetical protein
MSQRVCWHDGPVKPSDVARASHPRTAAARTQVVVLLLAVLLGLGFGALLRYADDRSWSGATTTTAIITGLRSDGVHAMAGGADVVLHLAKVPAAGTELAVEVRRDGRARPVSYRQTWGGALLQGTGLAVGLTVVVQLYRYAVTGRKPVG